VKKGGIMKRAFVQVPYSALSRILFGNKGIGIYRVGDDSPGPNGYVEFIVYGSENSDIERGAVYRLELKKLTKLDNEI
jgi:hypothetical protein